MYKELEFQFTSSVFSNITLNNAPVFYLTHNSRAFTIDSSQFISTNGPLMRMKPGDILDISNKQIVTISNTTISNNNGQS